MATAGPVFQVAVFDPAATHIMGQAFDCACRSLHDIAYAGIQNNVAALPARRGPDPLQCELDLCGHGPASASRPEITGCPA
jgi:hypothetical protein